MRWLRIILLLLIASTAGADSLQWNASQTDETHPAPGGYRIHRGVAPGVYDTEYDAGLALQWPIPDDLYGSYYWAASAYNTAGQSGYSNEVFWQRAPPQYVGATNLMASKLQQQPEQVMATFGNVGYGASGDYEPLGTNEWRGSKFALSVSGDITSITARMQSNSGTVNCKAVIWDDNGTSARPGTLMGVSAAVGVTTTAGDFTFTFSTPVSLTSGSWWLCIISGGASRLFSETETGSWGDGGSVYSTPANNPDWYGGGTTRQDCIYATYTASGGGTSVVPVFMRSYRARRQ